MKRFAIAAVVAALVGSQADAQVIISSGSNPGLGGVVVGGGGISYVPGTSYNSPSSGGYYGNGSYPGTSGYYSPYNSGAISSSGYAWPGSSTWPSSYSSSYYGSSYGTSYYAPSYGYGTSYYNSGYMGGGRRGWRR